MTPVRTAAPADPVVSLQDLKAHLRVDSDDDDMLITAYQAAAVGWLDGYRGVLGRCIMPQTWAVTYDAPGTYRLPFPGVQAVEADAGTATLSHDALGSLVTLTEAATVTLTAKAPDDILASVQMIVKLMVGHWYANREAVTQGSFAELPMAVNALLAPIRWVRI